MLYSKVIQLYTYTFFFIFIPSWIVLRGASSKGDQPEEGKPTRVHNEKLRSRGSEISEALKSLLNPNCLLLLVPVTDCFHHGV